MRFSLIFILIYSSTCFLSLTTSVQATTITAVAGANVSRVGGDTLTRNEDTISPATNDEVPRVVSATADRSDELGSATGSASVDYQGGVFRATGFAAPSSDNIVLSSVVGQGIASLRDTVRFTLDAPATMGLIEVKVLWQVERIIDDFELLNDPLFDGSEPEARVSSIFTMNSVGPNSNGLGGFSTTNIFNRSGTDLFSQTLLLGVGGRTVFDYALFFQLSALASNNFTRNIDEDGSIFDITTYPQLADAGNSAFLNFVLPEGVTMSGGATGFLATARDLGTAPIPLPTSGLLLIGGLGFLVSAGRRRIFCD